MFMQKDGHPVVPVSRRLKESLVFQIVAPVLEEEGNDILVSIGSPGRGGERLPRAGLSNLFLAAHGGQPMISGRGPPTKFQGWIRA